MSTGLVTVTTATDLVAQQEYAKALAVSNLLPGVYRQHPENVLVAIAMGDALGLKPIEAINQINIIKGKPSLSADLIAALVRRAGHKLRITTSDDPPRAVAQLIRADDPDFVFEVVWDKAKAVQAGLWGRGEGWKHYPVQMLRSRAISEIARTAANDALSGFIYTPEELGGKQIPDGIPQVDIPNEPAQPPRLVPKLTPVAAQPAPIEPEDTAQTVSEVTDDELRVLNSLAQQLGMTTDSYREFVCEVTHRDIQHLHQLTAWEYERVLAALQDALEGSSGERGG